MVTAEKPEDKKVEDKKTDGGGKKPVVKEAELTEDDQKLKDDLDANIQRLQDDDTSLYHAGLEFLCKEIRAATTSMTSVPKPLKFLRPHFDTIIAIHDKLKDGPDKKLCADIISVLAMTMGTGRNCLKYHSLGSNEEVGAWGHEYVRHLALELGEEYRESGELSDELQKLMINICKHHVRHNAEAEAVDLLMELERLDALPQFVDEHTQPRVCLYLLSCVPYVPDPDNVELLRAALKIYEQFGKRLDALRTSIIINDRKQILTIFYDCPENSLEQKQMAFILGRQQVFIDVREDLPNAGDLSELISNTNLSTYFLQLSRELDIMEPKTPEDIYKTHLEPSRPFGGAAQVDSARQNLANTFVNGLVNCGFGVDKLVTEDANKWFYKNKEHGMFSAAASQGLIYRWDIDNGLTMIDKYLYANEEFIKAGSLLAIGIISSGVQHECDPAAALLLDYVNHDKQINRVGSILGLGLAYANSSRESVGEQVLPALIEVLSDSKATPEVLGVTGLALGQICVGTGKVNADVAMQIWSALEDKEDLSDANYRFLALAIGLIYLGRQEEVDVILESLQALPAPFKNMAVTLVESCAYAGTGNVLKIQHLLHICSQPLQKDEKDKDKDKDKKDDKATSSKSKSELPEGWLEQSVAVLGIALIASAEDVGNQMSFRMFGHLLRYGDVWIRRAVTLALALGSASNPKLNIMETLSKFSHDADQETAYCAIFAMGLVGAGTNNARLGAMLRQLAGYHQQDPLSLFLVRLSQGLTHMGKGTLTLHPYHYDRSLLCLPSLAALLVTAFSFLDVKNTILGRQHYLLYNLVPAIQPRMLITFEEDGDELKQVNVSVRVGQAVDVVGQAGKPKTITGFQTHTTPVLLAYGERAELATDEYLSVSPILDGFVILKKNPDFKKEGM